MVSKAERPVTKINPNREHLSERSVVKIMHPQRSLPEEPRQIYFMRHAERVDLAFGHDWYKMYIDETGYHRRNLNLPRKIPTRRGGPKDFYMDSPITEIGTFQSRLIGEALLSKGVVFSEVYTSPAFRCIGTALSVLEGMNMKVPLKLEPSLFEWMAWSRGTIPNFMLPEEVNDYGIKVDLSYKPVLQSAHLNTTEKSEDFYERSYHFVKAALQNIRGSVLMVGHSATLDVCSRQLLGSKPRNAEDLVRVVQKVPFCGLCVTEETPAGWELVQAPIPSLIHCQNAGFDWRVLLDEYKPSPFGRK